MDKNNPKSYLGLIVVLGSVWGLSEAALGMGLRSCAAFVSGSIMTGVALFFMATPSFEDSGRWKTPWPSLENLVIAEFSFPLLPGASPGTVLLLTVACRGLTFPGL